MREYATLLALLSAALFGWVLGSEADEIGLRDLSVLSVALILILAIQTLVLRVVWRRLVRDRPATREWLLPVVTAVLLGCNAYFLAFYTLEQSAAFRITCAVIVGVAFLFLMLFPRSRPALAIFSVALLVMSVAQYAFVRTAVSRGDAEVTKALASLPVKSKRNIYIIGMESLQSPAAYRKNYGVDESPHTKALRDLGFRVFDHAYSAERSTMRSYAAIFEFHRDIGEDELGKRSVFFNDNSTFRSFRESGYDIQFLYKNNYFPVDSDNVTYFFPPSGFDACDELGPYYFYGLCDSGLVDDINKIFFGAKKLDLQGQMKLLQDRTDYIQGTSRPWFTWTHIKYPFHTHGYMRHPDPAYAEQFTRRVHAALPQVADNVKQTAGYIIKKDPNAVVIVLGDHGTHLFRGDEETVKKQVAAGSPLFPLASVLEDQHGITLAVYPADFCENRIGEGFSSKALIENVIACLNGDDSPTAAERTRARTIRFLGDLKDIEELRP